MIIKIGKKHCLQICFRKNTSSYLVTWKAGFSEAPKSSSLHHWENSKIFHARTAEEAANKAKEYEGDAHYFILTDIELLPF